MIDKPLTFLFDFDHTNNTTRPYVMKEFAENGAEALVLTDTLISQVIQNPRFAPVLEKNISDAGLTFVDSHAPFGVTEDLDVPDPKLRPLMLDRLKVAMRVVADFGVDTICIHTGNTSKQFEQYSLQDLDEAIIHSLEELLPIAHDLNLVICIENIWFPTNTPEKLLDIINYFNSESLGICYDSGHANLMAKDRGFQDSHPIQAWQNVGPIPYDDKILEKLLPHVVNCHLHDNNGQYDSHLTPGDGNIDWRHIMPLLAKAPRLRSIQSEVIPVMVGAPIAKICRTFEELIEIA